MVDGENLGKKSEKAVESVMYKTYRAALENGGPVRFLFEPLKRVTKKYRCMLRFLKTPKKALHAVTPRVTVFEPETLALQGFPVGMCFCNACNAFF